MLNGTLEQLQTEIKEKIENAINDIFAEYQQKSGITSGDVEPLLVLDLDTKTAEIAETATSILLYQEWQTVAEIAERVIDFAYQNDYWDMVAYHEEKHNGEEFDKDLAVTDMTETLLETPDSIIDYLKDWEMPEADAIAEEIRQLTKN